MTAVTVEIRHDLKHHVAVRDSIASGRGVVREVMKSYERIYRNFVIRRFDLYSRGGGDWKPNAPMTIALKRSSAILVDTRQMRLGLATAVRTSEIGKDFVTFQFRNEAIHPTAKVPIAELLTKHDKGLTVPKRPILVLPDDDTKQRCLNMATRRYTEAMNGD